VTGPLSNPTGDFMNTTLHRTPKMLARAVLRRMAQPIASMACAMAGAICSVSTPLPMVALTFDDGPNREVTPKVLRILRRHDARATFFMVGENAQTALPLVRRVADEGHAIGNHTWSHLSLPLLTPAERWAQLCAGKNVLAPYGAPLFRPPYGQQSWHCRWQSLRLGYEVVAFSLHVEDWLERDVRWMATRLIERTKPGSIIILHDNIYRNILPQGQLDRRPMLAALDRALAELRRRYDFVTIPELLLHGTPVRANWYNPCPPELEPALRRHINEQHDNEKILAIAGQVS
jgi:peptidoglycan/xylan/chitin deacetylase (PgdA/CDA1 family)